MKIKKLNINSKLLNNLKDKTISVIHENGEKVVVVTSIATLAAAMGLTLAISTSAINKYDNSKEVLNTYYEQVDNIDDEKFAYYSESFNELEEYINLSEELHDLRLYSNLNGDINSYNYYVQLQSIEQVKNKINEFKELKAIVKADNYKVSDDMIDYSKSLYELRILEEQVNQKVKEGYSVVEKYGELNAKSMLASKYDVSTDEVHVYMSESGDVNSVVAGKSTNELNRYLDELNRVNQMDDGHSKIQEGGYNHDRNNLLKNAVLILTERSAKYIEKNDLINENSKTR